jgi:outer membrane cobalamin receptor
MRVSQYWPFYASVLLLCLSCAVGLPAQTSTGELRLRLVDAEGLALPSRVTLVSEATQVREALTTNAFGKLTVRHLAYGEYVVSAEHAGFAPLTRIVNLDVAMPMELTLVMHPAGQKTSVLVHPEQTLLERDAAATVNRIGRQEIEERQSSLPGRGLIDLVNAEPGWLYEGNAVLHPRGSEYQTQFVMDGIPLTENRSPGFGSQIEAADVRSMAIYTAGIPAEYGRKLGGVVEVNTLRNPQNGWHGTTELSGGSFATGESYAEVDEGWGRNSAGVSADAATTGWYENPPVLENYTNQATTGDFSGNYEREFSERDRLTTTARHEFARFLVPNEQVQEHAGQRQHRAVLETMGTAAWQHILSRTALADVAGMVRDDTVLLDSNAQSTPIVAAQDRGFRERYIKGTITDDWKKRQEVKAGFEADFVHLHEGFNYTITDPTQFDAGTPATFSFFDRGKDREEALFVEDTARLGHWTVAPGLRWDDYSLLVHARAWSPRLAASRYFPRTETTAHVSYDRVFQTPAFENLLLSSSPTVVSLDPLVLRKPVLPSKGNYYEVGISQGIRDRVRVDANTYLRRFRNYADDNPLLDTSISFPIAFQRASIFGAEGKVELPRWGIFSGQASYSYMLGTCYLPVTGGLFLGDQATQALEQLTGRLWVSQDQRNTLRTRWIAHVGHGLWLASGIEYGSGLPVDFDGTQQQALAEYGAALVDRVNFNRGRVDPSLAWNASVGRQWSVGDDVKMRLQAGGENLNNRINIIDFAGLFSGNAVAPPRSGDVRLTMEF